MSCYLCFGPAEEYVFQWHWHLRCGLLLILVLEAEVLAAVALDWHRGRAFWDG